VQHLPLNPAKLSGPCGRLRCCLTYEHEVYKSLRREMPRIGVAVTTPEGPGVVRRIDLLQERVSVSAADREALVDWRVSSLSWSREGDLPTPRAPDAEDHRGCPKNQRGNGKCHGGE